MNHRQNEPCGHEQHSPVCDCGKRHDHHYEQEHSPEISDHLYSHSHEDLLGESGEIPAVFSQVLALEFNPEISGFKLRTRLEKLLASLKRWAGRNKCFIGHIKAFAADGETFRLWLSTTGGKINVQESPASSDRVMKHCQINFTAIIFNTDEKTLRAVVLDKMKKELEVNDW